MPYIDNKVQKHYNLLYKRIIMNRSKSAVFGSEITLQIKSNQTIAFYFSGIRANRKATEIIVQTLFAPPFILLYGITIANKKGNINTVWSKILYFGSKRVKICLRLCVMTINT